MFAASIVQGSDKQSGPVILEVGEALAAALELRQWWNDRQGAGSYTEGFQLTRSFNSPTVSLGFFGETSVSGRRVPVMGMVEERLFDQPKSSEVERFRDELREFVLRYLMRVSDFRRPLGFVEATAASPRFLQPLSWCPNEAGGREGFGYSQHWYKMRGKAEVGAFGAQERFEIVDLRDIGNVFDWIVARVRIFDFTLAVRPFGDQRPHVIIPLEETSYIALSSDFIVKDEEATRDECGRTVIGRYGFGYGFIKSPGEDVLGYGPGQFDVAFQQFVFRIYDNGEIRVQLTFVANRPNRIANVPIAPFDWGLGLADALSFGLASPLLEPVRRSMNRAPFRIGSMDPISTGIAITNLLTARQAQRQLCISREQLERSFLVKHFDQHYDMVTGALQTWRQIPDWRDESALPEWVRTGISS